jgi:hypothetical protein
LSRDRRAVEIDPVRYASALGEAGLAAYRDAVGARRDGDSFALRYRERGDLLWRRVFVPLYRCVPWTTKQRAMHALRMTAEHAGWTAPPRRPAEPWRPPART